MAVQLPLPEAEGLPSVVLFHRQHPAEPRLLLQVPNPGATDSETYVVRLDQPKHKGWMDRLKGSQRLQELLMMEMHVAYEPATGASQPLADLDTPTGTAQRIMEARFLAERSNARDQQMAVRQRRTPAISRFRLGLMGHTPYGRMA